jgi:hypothetical protein
VNGSVRNARIMHLSGKNLGMILTLTPKSYIVTVTKASMSPGLRPPPQPLIWEHVKHVRHSVQHVIGHNHVKTKTTVRKVYVPLVMIMQL